MKTARWLTMQAVCILDAGHVRVGLQGGAKPWEWQAFDRAARCIASGESTSQSAAKRQALAAHTKHLAAQKESGSR